MRSMGQDPNKKELEEMMNEVDTDHNGYIDCGTTSHRRVALPLLALWGRVALNVGVWSSTVRVDEFVQLMQKQTSHSSEEEALEAWKLFNKKGRGVISAADFRYHSSTLLWPVSSLSDAADHHRHHHHDHATCSMRAGK